LAEAGGQDATHEYLADSRGGGFRLPERTGDGGGTQAGGRDAGEGAAEGAEGRASGAGDDDGVGQDVAPKQEVAFLNLSARPDSDLASLGHRDAISAKTFDPETEVLKTPGGPEQKFCFFFSKKKRFL
jgi:hypothetical protein